MAVAVEMEYRGLEDMALVGGVAMAVAVCLTTWPYQTWPYRTAMAANGSSHRSGSAWSGQRAPQDTETSAAAARIQDLNRPAHRVTLIGRTACDELETCGFTKRVVHDKDQLGGTVRGKVEIDPLGACGHVVDELCRPLSGTGVAAGVGD
eukprot:scaffold89981_cov63-Phaeocystis_antarctica.AAC.4